MIKTDLMKIDLILNEFIEILEPSMIKIDGIKKGQKM
jgi:hypothetical protein